MGLFDPEHICRHRHMVALGTTEEPGKYFSFWRNVRGELPLLGATELCRILVKGTEGLLLSRCSRSQASGTPVLLRCGAGAHCYTSTCVSDLHSLEFTVSEDGNEGFSLRDQHGSCTHRQQDDHSLVGRHPGMVEGTTAQRDCCVVLSQCLASLGWSQHLESSLPLKGLPCPLIALSAIVGEVKWPLTGQKEPGCSGT